jgi:hypothetical protein
MEEACTQAGRQTKWQDGWLAGGDVSWVLE